MSLQVWLPLNGNLNQQGLINLTNINNTSVINNNGKIGACYEFTSNQRFKGQLPTVISSPIGTIMGWFKFKNSATWYNMIQIGNDGGFATGVLSLYLWQGNKICLSLKGYDCTVSGCTTVYTIPNPISNTWYHIAASYDGTTAKIYLNGEEVLSTTPQLGSYTTGTYFYIGGTNNYYLNGFANDVRYYNNVLSVQEIKKISQGLALHWLCSGAPCSTQNYLSTRLPSGYTEIEYIEANNGAALDTGYLPTNNKTRVSLEMMPLNTADSAFLGTRGNYWLFYNIGGNYWYPYSTADKEGPVMEINKKIFVDWDRGVFNAWQGTHHEWADRSNSNGQDPDSMFLFNFHQYDGRYSYARLYWCKIWDDGIKVRDYIPAKRNSDSAVGLYDRVNNTFITNVNNRGTITAGSNINFTPFTNFGQIEYDISGYNYYGKVSHELSTMIQNNSKRYNNSLYFYNHYIKTENSAFSWFTYDECTISAWMKGSQNPSGYSGSIGVQHDNGSWQKYLVISNSFGGNLICQYIDGSTYRRESSNFLIDDNQWHHCVCTLSNGTNIKLYVDGEKKLDTTISWGSATLAPICQFVAGIDQPGSDEGYTGNLSDIRFYSTCLSDNDILELYQMGRLS